MIYNTIMIMLILNALSVNALACVRGYGTLCLHCSLRRILL